MDNHYYVRFQTLILLLNLLFIFYYSLIKLLLTQIDLFEMKIIDLRSDTVTKPSPEMWQYVKSMGNSQLGVSTWRRCNGRRSYRK